jgi:hypothetical protein
MKLIKRKIYHYPIGIWIAISALLLICLAWIMQAYSLLDWEAAIKLGVQNESFSGTAAEKAIADVERGVAIADIFWALPLTILALVGLLREKLIGFVSAMMVFAICVYFPLFYAFRESMDITTVLAAILLWAIPSLFGIIGLWLNRDLFKI